MNDIIQQLFWPSIGLIWCVVSIHEMKHQHVFERPGLKCCCWLNLSFDLTLHKSCLNFWLKAEIKLKSKTVPHPWNMNQTKKNYLSWSERWATLMKIFIRWSNIYKQNVLYFLEKSNYGFKEIKLVASCYTVMQYVDNIRTKDDGWY